MFIQLVKKQYGFYQRLICGFTSLLFIITTIFPPSISAQTVLNLPVPGSVVPVTAGFAPAMIKGVNLYPDNPLKFDFIIDKGETAFSDEEFKKESSKLIKYFLASLTVPENEMWVNLSPYEKNRIVPQTFGETEMGRDLLAQDYMLKQLTASLMNPDDKLGGEFWQRVYTKAQEKYGTTDIPMNTFNKIWIVPEKAVVYEHEKGAFVIKSHLKVMLEEDYLALEANKNSTKHGLGDVKVDELKVVSGVQSAIIKDLLIPEIEREVNEGKTFANLRQIYNAVILASWYKQALKESILGQVYVDQKKLKGVETDDKTVNEKIYSQYVESFKKGVYNFIKEDYNPETQEVINRKYFSGGVDNSMVGQVVQKDITQDYAALGELKGDFRSVGVDLASVSNPDPAMLGNTLPTVKRTVILAMLGSLLSSVMDTAEAVEIRKEFAESKAQKVIARIEENDKLMDVVEKVVKEFTGSSLTDQQKEALIQEVLEENSDALEDGKLIEGQDLVVNQALDMMNALSTLNSSSIIATQIGRVDSYEVNIYFLNSWIGNYYGINYGKNLVLNIPMHIDKVQEIRDKINKVNSGLAPPDVIYHIFFRMSDEEILKILLTDTINHELTHTYTRPIIDKLEENSSLLNISSREILYEIFAYLIEIGESADPKMTLRMLRSFIKNGNKYGRTGEIINREMLKRLGFTEFIIPYELTRLRREGQNINTAELAQYVEQKFERGDFNGKVYDLAFDEFLESRTDAEIESIAQEIYEENLGQLPEIKAEIPESFIENYRKLTSVRTQFTDVDGQKRGMDYDPKENTAVIRKDESKAVSHPDAAMITRRNFVIGSGLLAAVAVFGGGVRAYALNSDSVSFLETPDLLGRELTNEPINPTTGVSQSEIKDNPYAGKLYTSEAEIIADRNNYMAEFEAQRKAGLKGKKLVSVFDLPEAEGMKDDRNLREQLAAYAEQPGLHIVGEFDDKKPTMIFVHGAHPPWFMFVPKDVGSPADFRYYIQEFRNRYNIVVFAYNPKQILENPAGLFNDEFEKLRQTKNVHDPVIIAHSYGPLVLNQAIWMDTKGLYKDAYVIRLAYTAGVRLLEGVEKKFKFAFPNGFGADPNSRIQRAINSPSGIVKMNEKTDAIFTINGENDMAGPRARSSQIHKEDYARVRAYNFFEMAAASKNSHAEPIFSHGFIRAVDLILQSREAIQHFRSLNGRRQSDAADKAMTGQKAKEGTVLSQFSSKEITVSRKLHRDEIEINFQNEFWVRAGKYTYKISVKGEDVLFERHDKDKRPIRRASIKQIPLRELRIKPFVVGRAKFDEKGKLVEGLQDYSLRGDELLSPRHFSFQVFKTNEEGKYKIKLKDLSAVRGTNVLLDKPFQLGDIFNPYGHKIEGAVNKGRNAREITVVRWKDQDGKVLDAKLEQVFQEILKDSNISEDDVDLDGNTKVEVIHNVIFAIQDHIQFDEARADKLAKDFKNEEMLLGDASVDEGGVCRHQAQAIAAILERMIVPPRGKAKGILRGRIYYVRGPGHAWAVYQRSKGEFYVLDVAQGYFGLMDGAKFFSGYDSEGKPIFRLYEDYLPKEARDKSIKEGTRPTAKIGVNLKRPEKRADAAMVIDRKKGGIDLNPTILSTEIKRNGRGVIIPTFKGPVPDLKSVEGFIPNIINVTPITNLQFLLGLDAKPDAQPKNMPTEVTYNLSALPANKK